MPNDNKQNLSNSTDNQTPVNNNQTVTSVTNDMPPVVMEDTTPPMLNTTDLPIANTQTQTAPVVEEKKEESSETDSGSAAPNNDVVMAPVVTTQKKKFAGGRVIATILGLFLLVGGLGAGTILVQQNQNINEEAASLNLSGAIKDRYDACREDSGAQVCACRVAGVCTRPDSLDDPNIDPNIIISVTPVPQQGSGSECTYDSLINNVGVQNCTTAPVINQSNCAGCTTGCYGGTCAVYYPRGTSGCTDAGNGLCMVPGSEYRISGSGGGEDTPPGDNPTPTPPSITASCQNIKAYSSTWTALTNTQLSQLKTGDSVNFCVAGSATGGSFNKARFTINGALQAETTTVRPSSTDFCQTYVIPAAIKTFNVSAEINHVTLGWK